jgi:hypothetical protein
MAAPHRWGVRTPSWRTLEFVGDKTHGKVIADILCDWNFMNPIIGPLYQALTSNEFLTRLGNEFRILQLFWDPETPISTLFDGKLGDLWEVLVPPARVIQI